MTFTGTGLEGAFVLDPERKVDGRGYFARTWCASELRARGLDARIAQCSVSYNRLRGTLRGLHFQAPPHGEVKTVRCGRGAIYDVILDIRRESPTYGSWRAFELTAENGRMLYIPLGFAHGFQTLVDGSEVAYEISAEYSAEHARGVRWDDPRLAIPWPVPDPILSERDRALPVLGT